MKAIITAYERGQLRRLSAMCERIRERAESMGEDSDRGEGDIAYNALRVVADVDDLLADAAIWRPITRVEREGEQPEAYCCRCMCPVGCRGCPHGKQPTGGEPRDG